MKKKKYIILLVLGLLVVLCGLILYKFVFVRSSPIEKKEAGQQKGLTQEEKQKILEQLNSASATPLTAQEKTKILKQISTTSKPLLDDEKTKILEGLKTIINR